MRKKDVIQYGCLSKSLRKFLSINSDEERKEEYGNVTAAKYYERVVKCVNGSFKDHKLVVLKLPKDHQKKINFKAEYDAMVIQAVSKKFIEHTPDRFLNETINHLHLITKDIPDGPMKRHTIQDINKVLDWLEDIRYDRK